MLDPILAKDCWIINELRLVNCAYKQTQKWVMNLLFLEDTEPKEAPDIENWPFLEHVLVSIGSHLCHSRPIVVLDMLSDQGSSHQNHCAAQKESRRSDNSFWKHLRQITSFFRHLLTESAMRWGTHASRILFESNIWFELLPRIFSKILNVLGHILNYELGLIIFWNLVESDLALITLLSQILEQRGSHSWQQVRVPSIFVFHALKCKRECLP